MIEYANDSVIKLLRQYDMLSRSLNFINDITQKNDISHQMSKIIEDVLDITNTIYENKYKKIVSTSVYLMDDEKNRLLELINLISERRLYVNNQISSNMDLTGMSLANPPIMGEDKLDEFKSRVRLIERYKNNIREEASLKDDLSRLETTIKRASHKISNNKNLNRQLEERMIRIVSDALEKLNLLELVNQEKDIDLAYTELGYSLEKARANVMVAKRDCSEDVIHECENILEVTYGDYLKYQEKKLILKLMSIYKNPVSNYDDLFQKREDIQSIMSHITHSELYSLIGSELNKQYSSIKLEAQDAIVLENLIQEQDTKKQRLKMIQEENNSSSVQGILSTLLENERQHQAKLEEIRKKKEEERLAQEKVIEEKKRAEMLKRQRILEEERNREIERRTKQLLDEKKNSVIGGKNESSRVVSSKDKKESVVDKKIEVKKNINVPKNDIFSKEIKNSSVVNKGIPVVMNNKIVNARKDEKKDTLFPSIPIEKKDNIFPDIPNRNNHGSFFDENEFNDLSDYMEDKNKKSWF